MRKQLKENAAMEWADDIVYTDAGSTRTMAPRPHLTLNELPLPEIETDWTQYYRNILGALDGRETLIVKPEQCLRVMRMIDLMKAADQSGQSQKCYV